MIFTLQVWIAFDYSLFEVDMNMSHLPYVNFTISMQNLPVRTSIVVDPLVPVADLHSARKHSSRMHTARLPTICASATRRQY